MDHFAPSEDSYGPWVLVIQKKQVNRKGNKSSIAQASAQAESLPKPKIDPSGPTEKVWKNLPRPPTKDSVIVANRTNQDDDKDITSTLIPQSTSNHHSRNSRNYQKSHGAPSSKGGSLNHTLEGKQLNFGHAFKYPMDKPLVFTASCADEANPNILADGDQSDKDDGIQMEAMEVSDNKIPKLPLIKTPLRESTNEKSVTKGNLGDIIAATSLNVSKAMLK